jgi:hypothetical protein
MDHISFSGRSYALAAALCTIAMIAAPAQQSHPAKASGSSNGQNQGAEVRTEKIKFKQEFGSQAAGRHGDGSSAGNQHGAGKGNHGSAGSASEVKQEFGPQVVARRGDRMTTAAPPASSGGSSKASAPAAVGPGGQPTKRISPQASQNKPQ